MNNEERIKNLQANSGKYFILTGIWLMVHVIMVLVTITNIFSNGWNTFLITICNSYVLYKMLTSAMAFGKALTLLDLLREQNNTLCKNKGTKNEKEGNQ